MPRPHSTPEYRAALRAARQDPTYHERHQRDLQGYLEQIVAFRTHLAGAAYPNLPAFLLAKGRPYAGAPRPKGLRKMTNKLCFRNTLYTVWDHPDWRYVEGYALSFQGIPCEHAWAVTPDGIVVDPTWYEPDLAAYYGVEIPLHVVGQSITRHRVFGVLVNDWRNECAILRTGQLAPDHQTEEETCA